MICEALDFTLTQPRATLGAGALAVVAASIAYLGVLKNLGEQRKAERRKRRSDLILEAASEMHLAVNSVLADSTNRAERKKLAYQAQATLTKLEVLGFEKAAAAARVVIGSADAVLHDDPASANDAADKFANAIKTAVAELKAALAKAEHAD
ncbi:hypothetical protein [Nocardia sp. NPDC005825]|uniref:hypothetical protein n=1 Tax=unclassified Nocardia TaxID=2637762 RepID=UPI0033D9D4D8